MHTIAKGDQELGSRIGSQAKRCGPFRRCLRKRCEVLDVRFNLLLSLCLPFCHGSQGLAQRRYRGLECLNFELFTRLHQLRSGQGYQLCPQASSGCDDHGLEY